MEELLKNLLRYEAEPEKKEEINLSFFDQYQFDSFIASLDRRSDEDILSFMKQNAGYISAKIVQNQFENPEILISEKFLKNFCRLISSIEEINQTIKTAANKICYDFLTSGIENENCYNLARLANKKTIEELMGIGLDEGTAANLALCRYSSMKEKINIRRLNFVICTKDIEVMTLQRIVFIYEKLFDRIGDLFKETMFEYYTPEQEIDFGSDFLEIYSTISLAVLTLVNNMSMVDIDRLIRGYVSDWEYIGRPPTRFSLISLSADYHRIQSIVRDLTSKKIYVP